MSTLGVFEGVIVRVTASKRRRDVSGVVGDGMQQWFYARFVQEGESVIRIDRDARVIHRLLLC